MAPPSLTRQTLRKDLLAGSALFEMIDKAKGPVAFPAFEARLHELGLDDDQAKVAIDMLFDQGLVKTAPVARGTKTERGIEIAGEAQSFLKALYGRTSGLLNASAS